ncbi:MAG: phosphate ABC transporter permease PstA, partial [Demequinaceae bacterium]|nr:phosphate ABC transporter permease PstA [Demequinaceae bacterium]
MGSTVRAAIHPRRLANRNRGDTSPRAIAFLIVLWLCLAIAVVFLVTLIAVMLIDGWQRLDSGLLTEFPSSRPAKAGARPAILGTLWVVGTTAGLAIPLGVAAAVHLEEMGNKNNWFNRIIEVNVQNLAAVPSIIYGLLTLGVLTAMGIQVKNIVIGGAIALALLILPVILIATREALRAVPQDIRQGSLALGATPFQTVWRQVLPSAIPGIATGSIIALSRAIGEAAPLLVLGGLVFMSFDPNGLMSQFTSMPIQIFNWSSRPQVAFHELAAAASIVLLIMLFLMNGL